MIGSVEFDVEINAEGESQIDSGRVQGQRISSQAWPSESVDNNVEGSASAHSEPYDKTTYIIGGYNAQMQIDMQTKFEAIMASDAFAEGYKLPTLPIQAVDDPATEACSYK